MAGALLVLGLHVGIASALAPTVSTPTATAVTESTATLKGTVNPGSIEGTKWRFAWGTANCAIKPNPCKFTTKGTLPLGSSPVAVEKAITGLIPGTIYHFLLEAENEDGTVISADRIFATLSAPSTGLPDNRAYEQASPTDKNGEDAQGQLGLTKATASGDGITFFGTFGIPGGKGAQALPSYLSLRDGSGWANQGLLPPPDLGERAQVQGWLPDFSKTYANATKLGDPRVKAMVEQSTDGITPPKVISPYTAKAEYSFVGASEDASVVLFESEAQLRTKTGGTLISAAIPGAPNVYAWDRATEELSLAGILNNEEAPAKGTIAGPYAWSRGIEANTLKVGGARNGYYLRGTRAFSESGDIYFTEAGTGQLYLRLNPTQPQSAMSGGACTEATKACTIHVSASKRATPDTAGPQPAAFQAASADGSIAYFTSPEKLTDESNTGPEQPEAAIGKGTTAKAITDADLVKTHAIGVATSATHLYWADPTLGAIGRSDLDGANKDDSFIGIPPGECEVEVEIAPFEFEVQTVEIPASPRYVTVDATEKYVYWTNTGLLDKDGEPIDGGGTIGRAELDGSGNLVPDSADPDFICGEVEPTPGDREDAISNPQGIAVNATHVYWTNAAMGNNFNRSLARAEIDGGEVEGDFVAPPTFNSNRIPQGVALDASHAYFGLDAPGEIGNSYIMRVTLAGTEPNEFGGFHVGDAGIRGLAIDATHVYWANQGEEAIGRVPLGDLAFGNCFSVGTCETVLEPEGDLNGLALSGTDLFWSINGEAPTNPGNDLYRFEASGGGGTLEDLTFVSPLDNENGAEVQGVLGASEDGSRVYFAANADLDEDGEATAGDCETPKPHGSIEQTKGSCSIYLWDEGEVSFIARVKGADATNWTGTPREVFSSFAAKSAFLTADGQTLLFRSQEKLTDYDNEGKAELYRFRVGDPELRCVSCPPSGEAPGSGPSLGSVGFPGTISPLRANMGMLEGRNLSADGDRFFFETGDALVPGDTNGQGGCPPVGSLGTPGCLDVYEWEAPGTGSCTSTTAPAYSPLNGGCLYLISTGKSPYPSYFADASESGGDVFFFTRESLVGQDKDELQDVYDARVGGGIAAQNPTPVPICDSGESCHGPYPGAPAESSPATPTFVGPQNPKGKKPAAKGKKHKAKKHKKKKQKKGKKKSKQKRANAKRGAAR